MSAVLSDLLFKSCSGPISAQKLRANLVPMLVFSHLMDKVDFCHFHNSSYYNNRSHAVVGHINNHQSPFIDPPKNVKNYPPWTRGPEIKMHLFPS